MISARGHIDYFAPGSRRRLVLKKERERSVSNHHPWVFAGSIAKDHGPDDAAIADLFDSSGHLVASGFYSRSSQIRLRAIAFGEELTARLLTDRIRSAAEQRRHFPETGTTAFRLIHSEGDGLSGLVVDLYGGIAVVEITSAGLDQIRKVVLDALQDAVSPATIYLKNSRSVRRLEGLPLEDEIVGEQLDQVTVSENGLQFLVDVRSGQKTGFFLDQRENRSIVRSLSAGRSLLNVFSYSGGFGVYAAAGGARSVEEVDISGPALEMARLNHGLNRSSCPVVTTEADAFDYLRELSFRSRSYDLIVCDPPAFAKSKHDVDRAARGYKDINMQALKLVEPGGHLATFSCSGHISLDLFQKIVFSAALDARREVSVLRRLGAGEDHPVSLFCPEGEYLKGFLLRVG